MALRGNLRDLSIIQLLNLINLAHKTGTLVVEGPNDGARISFRGGKLAYATRDHEEGSLVSILYKSRKISTGLLKAIQDQSGRPSDKELGLLLINAGYVSQEDILNHLQMYFTDVVQRLFTWVEGSFRFDEGALPPEDRICISMSLENLIIEGSRQMHEWEQLQDEIPSLEMTLKFTERPSADLRHINMSVEEWKVVSYINPRNTLRQIAAVTRMSDLGIRRVVYGLLQAGLVEIYRPEGALPPPITTRLFPRESLEEQRSLVNRLIIRIRSL